MCRAVRASTIAAATDGGAERAPFLSLVKPSRCNGDEAFRGARRAVVDDHVDVAIAAQHDDALGVLHRTSREVAAVAPVADLCLYDPLLPYRPLLKVDDVPPSVRQREDGHVHARGAAVAAYGGVAVVTLGDEGAADAVPADGTDVVAGYDVTGVESRRRTHEQESSGQAKDDHRGRNDETWSTRRTPGRAGMAWRSRLGPRIGGTLRGHVLKDGIAVGLTPTVHEMT